MAVVERMSAHENPVRVAGDTGPSNRKFGLVFTAFFLLLGLAPLRRAGAPAWWALGISGLFLVLALAAPAVLTPLNRLWMQLGQLLHRLVSPVILGFLFYGVFTPFGVFCRLMGKDFLRLKKDSRSESFWILRQPPGPAPGSMERQF